jgi:erythromycin esterase
MGDLFMRALHITAVFVGIAACLGFSRFPSQVNSTDQEFLSWAGHTLHPLSITGDNSRELKPIGKIVGGAKIVAVGEGVHGAAEGLAFRNRLFKYLVEEFGFTAVAIESGITESRVMHDYISGGPGDIATVVREGIGYGFDRFPQNEQLIQWMRDYNRDPRHKAKLQFFGFDLPGGQGNPYSRRDLRTALEETLGFLGRVDPTAEGDFRRRLSTVWPRIRLLPDYGQLSEVARDHLTAVISDLISWIAKHEAAYTKATSKVEYQWAYRNAIGARQADTELRYVPIGWKPQDGADWIAKSWNDRDRAMADNLDWIVNQLGPEARILVFVHRTHLAGTSVRFKIPAVELPGLRSPAVDEMVEPFGTYLRRQYGQRLITIGGLNYEGATGCKDYQKTQVARPKASTLEGMLSQLGVSSFALDLHTAPSKVAAWLNRDHELWGSGSGDTNTVSSLYAFDVLFFSRTVTPACPDSGD